MISEKLFLEINGDSADNINLYELMNKCKVWALSYRRGYCIKSFIDFDGSWFANISGTIIKHSEKATTEYDAVFNACEWIIDLEERAPSKF